MRRPFHREILMRETLKFLNYDHVFQLYLTPKEHHIRKHYDKTDDFLKTWRVLNPFVKIMLILMIWLTTRLSGWVFLELQLV